MSAFELLDRGRHRPWTLGESELHQYKTLEQAEDREWEEFCERAPLYSEFPPPFYRDECPELDDTYHPDEEEATWWATNCPG